MIGGYPSTTFISVPLDKVGFLFAAGADGLVRPLNILFRDAANVEWIQ
jgi:sialyltransferase PMO188